MAGGYNVARIEAEIGANLAPFEAAMAQGEARSASFASTTQASLSKAEASVQAFSSSGAAGLQKFSAATSAAMSKSEASVTSFATAGARGMAKFAESSAAASRAIQQDLVGVGHEAQKTAMRQEQAAVTATAAMRAQAAATMQAATQMGVSFAKQSASMDAASRAAQISGARVSAAAREQAAVVEAAAVKQDAALATTAVRGVGSLNKLEKGVIKYGALVAGGTFAAATAGIIMHGSKFEESLSKMRAATSATSADMKVMSKTATDLGARTAYSDIQVAEAMTEMGKAGFTASQTVAAIPGVLDAAAASGEDLAQTSTVVANTLSQFNLKAGESGRVADVLAKASVETQGSIQSMGEALKYAGTNADQLGLDIEQTTGLIALMVKAGIDGSQAGTSTRMGLQRIAQGANASHVALKKLAGVSPELAKVWKSSEPVPQKLRAISTEFAKMDGTSRTVAAGLIFGTEASTGMLKALQGGPAAWDAWTRKMREAKGTAHEMSRVMRDNLRGDIDQLTGALGSAATKAYAKHKDELRRMVSSATDIVNGADFAHAADQVMSGAMVIASGLGTATKFAIEHKDAIIAVAGAYATFKGTLSVLDGVAAIGSKGGMLGRLIGVGSKGAAAAEIGAATAEVGALGAAMAAIPALPVAAGMAALGGATLLAVRHVRSSRAEDEKWAQQAEDLAGAITKRQMAAQSAQQADGALAMASVAATQASEKFGANSRQAAAALDREKQAAKDAAQAHRDYAAAASAENKLVGSKVSANQPTRRVSAGDRATIIGRGADVSAELDAAHTTRRMAAAYLSDATAKGKRDLADLKRQQSELVREYDKGSLSLREFGKRNQEVADKIDDVKQKMRESRKDYDAADRSVEKLERKQRALRDAMGNFGGSITSGLTPTINRIVGLGATFDDVKAKILSMSRTKPNLQVAAAMLKEMTAAERQATFGTSSINQILGRIGKQSIAPDMLNNFTAYIQQMRANANVSVTVTTTYRDAAGNNHPGKPKGWRAASGAPTLGAATGGPIYGKGTGTSDDIPAWLSNGEHVITAAEVKAAGGHEAIKRQRAAWLSHGNATAFANGGPVKKKISPADLNKDGKVTAAEKKKYAAMQATASKNAAGDLANAKFNANTSNDAIASKKKTAEENLKAWAEKEQRAINDLPQAKKEDKVANDRVKSLQARYDKMKSGTAKTALGKTLKKAKDQAKAKDKALSEIKDIIANAKDKRSQLASDIVSYQQQLDDNAAAAPNEAWQAKSDEWAELRAAAEYQIAQAEGTPGLDDDAAAYANAAAIEDRVKAEATAFSTDGLDAAGRTTRQQEITSAMRAAAEFRSKADDPAGIKGQDAEAQREQAERKAAIATEEARIANASLMAFNSTGDIGFSGGANAFQSAAGMRPTVVNNINALSGYDRAIQTALASSSNGGNSTGGNADKLYQARQPI